MSDKIFRKVALERLSSPEKLDQLIQITRSQDWLALLALGVLLTAVIAWSFYGVIPTEATGTGILLRRGGVVPVVAASAGQIDRMAVAVGDPVAKGDVIAVLRQEGLARQRDDARARQQAVQDDYAALLRYADEQRRLRARGEAGERASLTQQIETATREIELLDARLSEERSLLEDGLVTRQAVLATEQQLNTARGEKARLELQRENLALKRLEDEQALAQQIAARETELRELELTLGELTASLEESVNVLSPSDGRVVELLTGRGDVVSAGTAILNLEQAAVTADDETLQAVLYIPAALGKQVHPGMIVRVSPSTVKREEYGTILGEVTWVAAFPSTARGMERLIGNRSLVDRMMLEGPPIQVDVRLLLDPATPTGYRWSSSRGPDVPITSGTLASGSVVVREAAPIELVIPMLRGRLGL
ncbi:MAG: NHLP bacteriocin system secretion protein [Acidobacteriota bacterium]